MYTQNQTILVKLFISSKNISNTCVYSYRIWAIEPIETSNCVYFLFGDWSAFVIHYSLTKYMTRSSLSQHVKCQFTHYYMMLTII